jgi:hypothetical protein
LFITHSLLCSLLFRTKKNPKSIATVGVFKFRRYEKGITFAFQNLKKINTTILKSLHCNYKKFDLKIVQFSEDYYIAYQLFNVAIKSDNVFK